MSDEKPEESITEILLDDLPTNDPNVAPVTEKKKHYIPFIPKMYWLFYRHPLNFLVIIPSFVAGWVQMITNVTMGNILDSLTLDDPMPIIKKNALITFIASIASAIFNFINFTAWNVIGDSIGIKIRTMLFKSMLKKDVEFFDTHTIGDILTLLSEDARSVESSFTSSKTAQLRAFGQLFSALLVCFQTDWRLSLFSMLSTCAVAYIVRAFRDFARKHMRSGFKSNGRATTIAAEVISNMRILNAFNRQDQDLERYYKEANEASEHMAFARNFFSASFGIGNMLNWGTVCVILNVGCYFINQGQLTAGTLFALSRAAFMVGMEINHILGTINQEQKSLDAASRIYEIMDEIPSVPYDNGVTIPGFRGDIEFKNVWFKYPTRDSWVLKDVSFRVEAGEIAAFVGHSGSGKSTIVQLLLRFYDCNEGKIYLDGVDIKNINPRWLHQMIGVVQQDPILFAMSVKENILYGVQDANDDQIVNAAQIANADNFIRKLPYQYETMIGEKGSTLSGGQKQRVAIARAILKDPTILLTDEATSALDAASEKKVQKALDEVMKGRTSIIVAHRLGTIKGARLIYVLESGELVECGTHEELIAKEGHYYTLVQRQLADPSVENINSLS